MSDTTDTGPAGADAADAATVDAAGDVAGDVETHDDRGSADRAEAAKWKDLARKHEADRKKLEKQLEQIQRSQMSDQEKAVAEAEARGRQAAAAEFAQERAAARIEIALTGLVPDPASIVEDLNLSRYVDGDGQVDAKAVKALTDKFRQLQPKNDEPQPRRATDFGQGRRQGAAAPSLETGKELYASFKAKK